LDAFIHRFRLATGSGAQGLRCGADGLSLAGVSLLRKSTEGFAARAPEEVGALMLAAYGDVFDRDRLARGLRATASALNRGDVDLAMIAAVHLRLPDLDAEAASRIAAVDDFLAKYDPDEPRDWRGRWTTGGEGAPRPAAQPPRGAGARADSETRSANKPESNWDGVSHPTGGHLIPTGGGSGEDFGDNEPPPWEGRVEPDSPPAINAPKVPRGWDRVEDGALVRRPMLRNGQPWPEASVDSVLETLRRERGAPPPRMWILVPLDGKGPPLVGSTGADEFLEPPGYEKVELIGMPQETWRQGIRSNHARDSAEAALRYAMSNNYSRIYFNSALSTSTEGEVDAPLRPDMLGVVRPGLDLGYRFKPYESYSPRQAWEARESLLQLIHPAMGEPEGQFYKFLIALWTRLLRKLAARGKGARGRSRPDVPSLFLTVRRDLLTKLRRTRAVRNHGDKP